MPSTRTQFRCALPYLLAGLIAVMLLPVAAHADEVEGKKATVCGNVDFDFPDAPPATMEVDVSQGLFKDLFGLGEAAVAGMVEGLAPSAAADDGDAKAAAEGLQAAQQAVQLVGKFVQGARFSSYEMSGDKSDSAKKIDAYYTKKLRAQNWQTLVRIRDGEETYAVSALRSEGAIKGIFIFAADGDDVYLMNLVCDISPENVKQLTGAAAQLGIKLSMSQDLIKEGMRKVELALQSPGLISIAPAPSN
ncbi:MAG TPA: DUF4252 domain-containing protein [Pirellulales bacterium]